MLTPSFELSQDDAFLTIVIRARYAKISEAEIYVDGTNFKFYSKPYFLRLTLPGCIIEDGRESAKYDVEKGYFTITVPKETHGEHFDGLDMLTTLLAPAGKTSATEPVLEVIDTEPSADDGQDQDISAEKDEAGQGEGQEEEEEIDWQVPQEPFVEDEMSLGGSTYYGFANRRTGVFERLQDELCGIVDVSNPDSVTLVARREARQQADLIKFDEDHYIADFLEDDCIQAVLEYKTPWDADYRKLTKHQSDDEKLLGPKIIDSLVILTEEERDQMIKLSKKNYLLDQKTETGVLLGLIDILFAYAYDIRTTEGEHSVESAWTICKLSATFSWLDWFTSLDDVIHACFTRGLSYPLYRHWQLNLQVLKDVTMMFHLGRKQLLKCLLDIHQILSHDEPHYILNDLYVTDYCIWIQSVGKAKIASLAQALDTFQIDKSQMMIDLQKLEHLALEIKEEEEDADKHDSDESSDDSSSEEDDSEDIDSDDDSADEGDDESEDILAKLTNAGRTKSKKQTHSCKGTQPCYYQYGYPEVLQSRHQHLGDSVDHNDRLDEDHLVGRPASDCSGVDTTSKSLISECDNSKLGLDIDSKEDDVNNINAYGATDLRDLLVSEEDNSQRRLSQSEVAPVSSNKLSSTSQQEFGMHNLDDIIVALDEFAIRNSEECEDFSCGASSTSQSAPASSVKFSQSSQDELLMSPSRPSSSAILSQSSQDDLITQLESETGAIRGSLEQNRQDVGDVPPDGTKHQDGTEGSADEDFSMNEKVLIADNSFESWMKAPPIQKIEIFSND